MDRDKVGRVCTILSFPTRMVPLIPRSAMQHRCSDEIHLLLDIDDGVEARVCLGYCVIQPLVEPNSFGRSWVRSTDISVHFFSIIVLNFYQILNVSPALSDHMFSRRLVHKTCGYRKPWPTMLYRRTHNNHIASQPRRFSDQQTIQSASRFVTSSLHLISLIQRHDYPDSASCS